MMQVGLNPSYGVKYYRDGFYKLIRYNHNFSPKLPSDPGEDKKDRGEGGKLSQARSRARSVVIQIGICNEWDYFFTGTIDSRLCDRYDLSSFYKSFSQWIRDERKRKNCKIEFLFIPEKHKDGAWHLHGFIRGLPAADIAPFVPGIHPQKLIENGFLNWGAYARKFGFCSLAPIRDVVGAAFYVTKYISKDMESSLSEFGAHTYYASIGLKRAQPLGYVYGWRAELDSYIDHVNEFCSSGYVRDVPWHFWLEYIPCTETFDWPSYDDPEGETVLLTNVPESDLQLSIFDLLTEEELRCCVNVSV